MSKLQAQVEALQRQLDESHAQNDHKSQIISSLERQLERESEVKHVAAKIEAKLETFIRTKILGDDEDGDSRCSVSTEADEDSTWTSSPTMDGDNPAHSPSSAVARTDGTQNDDPQPSRARAPWTPSIFKPAGDEAGEPIAVRDVVDEIQRWLFLEGGNLRSVESLLTGYCSFCRTTFGMPLDRLFVAGMMIHPSMSAYVWKWEVGQDFDQHEVPPSAFEKPNYNPNEPFAVLMEGRATEYRMKADGQVEIPPGCEWFTRGNYHDYLGLPIYHRGKFVGAMAWSTKSRLGFTESHVQIFYQSLVALSTVLRLHTNDLVVTTLVGRFEQSVDQQTKELAETNQRLEAAHAKVIQQSQAQLKHFAMMSHEIRTPLNCIVGLSNLLLEGNVDKPLDPEVEESILMITNSGDLLLAVVDDVLDYSKLASGNVEIEITPTNLRKTLRPMTESIRLKTLTTGLELRTYISDDLPEWIDTDGRRLQQILYNLLGNAAKFGEKGKYIDFSVKVGDAIEELPTWASTAESEDQATKTSTKQNVLLHVKDYGRGIAKEDMKKIFQPFQQSTSNSPADAGTGLGLAITSQLCKVLGGTISVRSEPGQWCEFVVSLPLIISRHCTKDESSRLSQYQSFRYLRNSSKRMTASLLPELPSPMTSSTLASEGRTEVIADGRVVVPSLPAIPLNSEINKHAATSHDNTESTYQHPQPGVAVLASSSTPSSSSTFSNFSILIAEDNLINQKVLVRTLQNIGLVDIDVVENGLLAVERSAAKQYDIVFMDWQMPIMNGDEATRIITSRRQHCTTCRNSDDSLESLHCQPNTEHPRVVFLTAHALTDYQVKAVEAGGDGFISKPFKSNAIKQLLEEFARRPTTS